MSLSDLPSIIAGFESMRSAWGKDTTPDDMRADFEAWCERFPDDREVSITRISAGGVPADRIDVPGVSTARVVLFLHGGGYSLGSARSHRALAKRIAFDARARVVLPEYRLAPEHVFPAAVDDAVSAYRWLLATGVQPQQIAVAGDSAGGGLVLALFVSLRDAGAPLPACAVLLSPFADLECSSETYTSLAGVDPIVSREMGLSMARGYLGGRAASDPLASPARASLRGLPPLLIQVGSREVLLDDARAIEQHARRSGVSVELDVWPDMIHVWHLFASVLDEGRRAIAACGAFMRRWTKE